MLHGSAAGNVVTPNTAATRQDKIADTPAGHRALEAMRSAHLVAAAAAMDVGTGEVLASAASSPSDLDVDTSVLPLSVAKLWLAASWWERARAAEPISVHEMIVHGRDDDGRRLAAALRRTVGPTSIVEDLRRWGATTILSDSTPDSVWNDALSIGEANVETDVLRVSRFLQAVGNDGVAEPGSVRRMRPETARRLQAAMLDAVSRGSGREIADSLSGTAWRIGGKTGTGPGSTPPGKEYDGWFAGLVADPAGRARFTVAAYVRRGGKGGGHAARICAALARSLAARSGPARFK